MRKKQKRFAQNEISQNVIQSGKSIFDEIKGNWKAFFRNDHDIVLELGCGRGEYTVGQAAIFSEKNFVGVDIKGYRIWVGSFRAGEQDLNNAAFLRTQIQQLEDFFEPNEVSEIWLIFPDPRPKDRDEKRRLTHPRFLEIYQRIMVSGGLLHLKTDNDILFQYSLETLQNRKDVIDLQFTSDLYKSEYVADHHKITTRYEKEFTRQGFKIKYLKCRFTE